MTKIKAKEKQEVLKELKELELRGIEVEHRKDPVRVTGTYYAWWGDSFGEYEFVTVHENLEDLVDNPGDFRYGNLKRKLGEKCMEKITP